MNNASLTFRMFKAVLSLPVPVGIIIPALLLYFFDYNWEGCWNWRVLLGIACLVCGALLVATTLRLFFKVGKGTLAPWDPARKMIISGPYAYVRNPMITGVVLILVSEALISGSWAIGVWAILFTLLNLIYLPLSEEPGLRKRFGQEYIEYCKHVPRYIPRLTPWKP